MSTIFPGNYVAHLNAYREQGVQALPGVEFYKAVGAVVLNPDTKGVTDVSGELAAGTYDAYVLSPDLRQDDKPRLDKKLVVPAGSVIYRVALSAPGVQGTAADTIEASPSGAGNVPTSPTLTAAADGFYPAEGAVSATGSILDGTAVTADTEIQVVTDGASVAKQNPSAGANRKGPSVILVEVCYYRSAAAPDAEDAHVPFAVEAGQGT